MFFCAPIIIISCTINSVYTVYYTLDTRNLPVHREMAMWKGSEKAAICKERDLGASSLLKTEKINFCHLNYPVYDILLWQS